MNKFLESNLGKAIMVAFLVFAIIFTQAYRPGIPFNSNDAGSTYADAGYATVVLPQSTDTSIWVVASAFAEVVYSGREESLARKVLTEELASRMQYGITVNDYINLKSYSQIRLSQKYANMSVSRADELGRDCRGETECAITAWAEKIEFYRANSQFVAQSQ